MRINPLKLVLFSLVCVAGAGAFLAPAAQAAKPCWEKLLADYLPDGKIDNTYRLHCYDDALRHLQPDVAIYGSAIDDIRDARSNALLALKRRGVEHIGPNTLIPPPGGGGGGGTGPSSRDGGGKPGGGDDSSPVVKTVKNLGPNDATSLPVPLIVLGSLGLLLLAAAAVSVLTRRVLARRAAPPQPAPVTVSDHRK
jgi:hypothetical protein